MHLLFVRSVIINLNSFSYIYIYTFFWCVFHSGFEAPEKRRERAVKTGTRASSNAKMTQTISGLDLTLHSNDYLLPLLLYHTPFLRSDVVLMTRPLLCLLKLLNSICVQYADLMKSLDLSNCIVENCGKHLSVTMYPME